MPLSQHILAPFTASLLCLLVSAALALTALPAKLRRRAAALLPIRVESNRRR